MGGAAARAGSLFGVLQSLNSPALDPSKIAFDAASLVGRSAIEVIDTIARFVSPSDGTQDAESSQRAVSAALSDLLEQSAGVDIDALTEQQIDWGFERHIGYEIFQRIELDVGKAIVDKAPSPAAAILRLKEMREYVEETLAAAFRSRRELGRPVDSADASRLASSVIEETFAVFEEYVE